MFKRIIYTIFVAITVVSCFAACGGENGDVTDSAIADTRENTTDP